MSTVELKTKKSRKLLGQELQIALLSLLAYSRRYGADVAQQVPVDLYTRGLQRSFAQSMIDYRAEYGRPPGRKQLAILLDDMNFSEEDIPQATMLAARLDTTRKSVNRPFVVKQARKFAVAQNYRDKVKQAALLTSKDVFDVETVHKFLYDAITYQPEDLDLGIRLSSKKSLDWLDQRITGYKLGIKPLDAAGIRLEEGTLLQYLARKNTGKSWFCVHIGREVTKRRGKVLHISLEMSKDKVAKRYHQSFNRLARKYYRYLQSRFVKNHDGTINWEQVWKKPKLVEGDKDIRERLEETMDLFHDEMRLMRIKDFPSGTLTMQGYIALLDRLSHSNRFDPDVVLIDYPDLMKINIDKMRHELNHLYVMFRGIGSERGHAIVAPSQVNRPGFSAEWLDGTHSAESLGKIFTADTVLGYSQTKPERDYGMARLEVIYARDTEVGTRALIAQSYNIGQYCLQAVKLGPDLERRVMALASGKDAPKDKEEAKKPKDLVS